MAVTANWKSRTLEVNLQKVEGEKVLEDQMVFEGLSQNGSLTGAFSISSNLDDMTDYTCDSHKVIDVYELAEAEA